MGERREGTERAPLEVRFCRKGAAYGGDSLEYSMGVRTVFHEKTTRLPGAYARCVTCGRTQPA